MCKHVAVVLYGIGVLFDENLLLFFQLRGIDVGHFTDVSLANHVDQLLCNAESDETLERVIDTQRDITSPFGVL